MDELKFKELRVVNVVRQVRYDNNWNVAEWGNALAGETGELCNVLKKMIRQAPGDPDPLTLAQMAGKELADIIIYADLLAAHLKLDLGEEVRAKFNDVSIRYGYPDRL